MNICCFIATQHPSPLRLAAVSELSARATPLPILRLFGLSEADSTCCTWERQMGRIQAHHRVLSPWPQWSVWVGHDPCWFFESQALDCGSHLREKGSFSLWIWTTEDLVLRALGRRFSSWEAWEWRQPGGEHSQEAERDGSWWLSLSPWTLPSPDTPQANDHAFFLCRSGFCFQSMVARSLKHRSFLLPGGKNRAGL